jgi:formylglycine-generating enzyme required for sulfatase activity
MTATPATGSRTATFLLRQPRQVQGFREQLRSDDEVFVEGVVDQGGVFAEEQKKTALTMLWIPPGRFWIGSPPTEPDHQDNEGPQHLVQLQGFFMGQTPITQAQWRQVASWQERQGERWDRELELEPSFFQPRPNPKARNFGQGRFSLGQDETNSDQRPVEQVSWHDAMEFCHRLSQRTGRQYTLPSEAQWEYACRAGSTTPFAFGATLTSELANYDASYTYGDGPKGEYRKQTTPVGMFPANSWGLHDMHGNVWEWCLDHWHNSYAGAPSDGSAWLTPSASEEEMRLLRGGSWFNGPGSCRSAYRDHAQPDNANDDVGFRVVCLPQGPSLNP